MPKPQKHIINTSSIIKVPKFATINIESKTHNKNGYYLNPKSHIILSTHHHNIINTSTEHHKHINTTSYYHKTFKRLNITH